jgi:methionine-rich copper-binding protein CopC
MPVADSTAPAPSEFVLQFSEPTQLTALVVEKEGGAPVKVEPLPAKADKELHVAAPKLAPGVYVIKWRGVGDDTHVMSGSLRFTVQ